VIRARIPTIDAVLAAHVADIGGDLTGYRNHAYRVANLCAAIAPGDAAALDKIDVAAAFHDLGIWTDGTFDYLEPSVRLAAAHLTESGRPAWIPEITAMIRDHHKVSPHRGGGPSLVEAFRRADWIDITKGWLTLGVPRSLVREILRTWPGAGFHRRLVCLSLTRLRTHPLSPLPMVRL
jgi:hypothetical protein